MKKQLRSLNREFVQFMHSKKAWPKPDTLRTVMSFGNVSYSQLCNGYSVSEGLILSILRAIVQPDPRQGRSLSPDAVEYLKQLGDVDVERVTDAELLSMLCSAPKPRGASGGAELDYLQRGFGWLADQMSFWFERKVLQRTRAFRSEDDLREAIRWIFISLGRQLAADPTLETERASELAAERIRLSPTEYARLATEWWRFDRWTVVGLCLNGRIAGVNIVLPVNLSHYVKIRDGQIPSYGTPATAMQVPTMSLVIEASAERPHLGKQGDYRWTRGMYYTMLGQVAALARLNGDDPLRLLSFAGSPTGTARLRSFGFAKVGNQMADTGVDMLERLVTVPASAKDDTFIRGMFHGLGRALSNSPEETEL